MNQATIRQMVCILFKKTTIFVVVLVIFVSALLNPIEANAAGCYTSEKELLCRFYPEEIESYNNVEVCGQLGGGVGENCHALNATTCVSSGRANNKTCTWEATCEDAIAGCGRCKCTDTPPPTEAKKFYVCNPGGGPDGDYGTCSAVAMEFSGATWAEAKQNCLESRKSNRFKTDCYPETDGKCGDTSPGYATADGGTGCRNYPPTTPPPTGGGGGGGGIDGIDLTKVGSAADFLSIMNPFNGGACAGNLTIGCIMSYIINSIVFPLSGIFLVLMIVWGGYQMVNGSVMGSQNTIQRGQQRIKGAFLGIIMLAAVYWLWALIEALTGIKIT